MRDLNNISVEEKMQFTFDLEAEALKIRPTSQDR